MNKSWKTTVSGVLLAVGAFIPGLINCINGDCDWQTMIANIMAILGAAGLGVFARDRKVTSEQEISD